MLEDADMVNKLLDSVPDRLYVAVADNEQFCNVKTIPFEGARGRRNTFAKRSGRRAQAAGRPSDK